MLKPATNSREQTRRAARKPSRISPALNHRLSAYALSATAAGVATVACSTLAEAQPVCNTRTQQISNIGTLPLNPADSAVAPFNIAQTTLFIYTAFTGGFISTQWNRGFFAPNSARANALLGPGSFPANLASGSLIGPSGKFGKGQSYGLLFTYGKGIYLASQGHGTIANHRGNFNLQQTNYVGFRFSGSDSKIHYGWARLSVSFKPGRSGLYATTHILGSAYESSPNTAIAAGSCSDVQHQNAEESDVQQQPAALPNLARGLEWFSLGQLALGSAAAKEALKN